MKLQFVCLFLLAAILLLFSSFTFGQIAREWDFELRKALEKADVAMAVIAEQKNGQIHGSTKTWPREENQRKEIIDISDRFQKNRENLAKFTNYDFTLFGIKHKFRTGYFWQWMEGEPIRDNDPLFNIISGTKKESNVLFVHENSSEKLGIILIMFSKQFIIIVVMKPNKEWKDQRNMAKEILLLRQKLVLNGQ